MLIRIFYPYVGLQLHIASACGYLDVACFLLQHGAQLDLRDREGWCAIHIAACWGQVSFSCTTLFTICVFVNSLASCFIVDFLYVSDCMHLCDGNILLNIRPIWHYVSVRPFHDLNVKRNINGKVLRV